MAEFNSKLSQRKDKLEEMHLKLKSRKEKLLEREDRLRQFEKGSNHVTQMFYYTFYILYSKFSVIFVYLFVYLSK